MKSGMDSSRSTRRQRRCIGAVGRAPSSLDKCATGCPASHGTQGNELSSYRPSPLRSSVLRAQLRLRNHTARSCVCNRQSESLESPGSCIRSSRLHQRPVSRLDRTRLRALRLLGIPECDCECHEIDFESSSPDTPNTSKVNLIPSWCFDCQQKAAADEKSYVESDTSIESACDADPPRPLHGSRECFEVIHEENNSTLAVSAMILGRFKSKEHRTSKWILIADTLKVG